MSKRIVIFNHKGGVSKTTTAYNLGWMIAKDYRVLLIDADPQCNLSGLVLGDKFEQYYFDEKTKNENIMDGAAPAFLGKPKPIEAVECFSPKRSENLFLLAGHANLSEFDAALTLAQTSNNAIATLQNLPGAFLELIKKTEESLEIDYTILDLNPGLSAVNQNLFLLADGFIVPTNPDPFSIMALQTLGTVLPRWEKWRRSAVDLFADSAYPLPEITPKFIGVLIQRFNIRKGRAARPYRDNINDIKQTISDTVFPSWKDAGMTFNDKVYESKIDEHYCLGEIPDFQGLLPKSHNAGVPIFDLTDSEIQETGPILRQFTLKRDEFFEQFDEMAETVINILEDE
ncbi:MAG: ParA family protein [Parvibaculum sp.]|uniref:ParA family protein n=1 Tax=Alphaproteobacteria TaxID=28211 RepID=UPI0032989018